MFYKIISKVIFFSFLFSCGGMVSPPLDIDLNEKIKADINSNKKLVKVERNLEFELSNINFAHKDLFGQPVILYYEWDINCDGLVNETTETNVLNYSFTEPGTYTLCVRIVYTIKNKPNETFMSVIRNENLNILVKETLEPAVLVFDKELTEFNPTNINLASSPKKIKIINTGEELAYAIEATLGDNFNFTNNQYPGLNGDCASSLDYEETCYIEVFFNPTSMGIKESVVNLEYNDGFNLAFASTNLKGLGTSLNASLSLVGSFTSNINLGQEATYEIILSNTGNLPLNFDSNKLSQINSPFYYSFNGTCTNGLVLSQNDNCSFYVKVLPFVEADLGVKNLNFSYLNPNTNSITESFNISFDESKLLAFIIKATATCSYTFSNIDNNSTINLTNLPNCFGHATNKLLDFYYISSIGATLSLNAQNIIDGSIIDFTNTQRFKVTAYNNANYTEYDINIDFPELITLSPADIEIIPIEGATYLKVVLGQNKEHNFTIKNIGETQAQDISVQIIGGDNAFSIIGSICSILIYEELCFFKVKFNPSQVKSYNATLKVAYKSNSTILEKTINLSGEGIEPSNLNFIQTFKVIYEIEDQLFISDALINNDTQTIELDLATIPFYAYPLEIETLIIASDFATVSPNNNIITMATSSYNSNYVITAQNGNTRTYNLSISIKVLNECNNISKFTSNINDGSVDELSTIFDYVNFGLIYFVAPNSSNLSEITPTVEHCGESINPVDKTQVSFNNKEVKYEVTAQNSNTKDYYARAFKYKNFELKNSGTHICNDINLLYVKIPSLYNKKFPHGKENILADATSHPFFVARNELTYDIWYRLVSNANHILNNANLPIKFQLNSPGKEGSNGALGASPSSQAHLNPVTGITWRDAIVFSNLLTATYKACGDTRLDFVYYSFRTKQPIFDASSDENFQLVQVKENDGFRLLNIEEWEIAARYMGENDYEGLILQDGLYWLEAQKASGEYANFTPNLLAWNNSNSHLKTQEIMTKLPNFMGVYDMSGNLSEFSYYFNSSRLIRPALKGGSYLYQDVKIGTLYEIDGKHIFSDGGIRIGRTDM